VVGVLNHAAKQRVYPCKASRGLNRGAHVQAGSRQGGIGWGEQCNGRVSLIEEAGQSCGVSGHDKAEQWKPADAAAKPATGSHGATGCSRRVAHRTG